MPWKTKVVLRWHKWPARSVCDKRRILMEKSLSVYLLVFFRWDGYNGNSCNKKNSCTRTLNNTFMCHGKWMQLACAGEGRIFACMQNRTKSGTNKNCSLKITSARFQLCECKLRKKQVKCACNAGMAQRKCNWTSQMTYTNKKKKKKTMNEHQLPACICRWCNEKCIETNNSNFGKT